MFEYAEGVCQYAAGGLNMQRVCLNMQRCASSYICHIFPDLQNGKVFVF